MSNSAVFMRFRRVGVVSIILAVLLLVTPLLGVSAYQWGDWLQAPIVVASGAVLGTATFTPASTGGVIIHVQVRGFDPVAGSHRIAIANVGNCCPPSFGCSGYEVVVLPDMQYNADGSGDYTTVTTSVTMDWLKRGASIVIHADTNPASAIIGCGVISRGGGSWPPPPGPNPPHPWPQPKPQPKPAPVVGQYRVTAALGLRLRSGPGLGYATRRIVPAGTILGNAGAEQWSGGILWARVYVGGAYYWAAKAYLRSV